MRKVTIYTKDYCPYCKNAKALLRARGFEYEEIEVIQQPKQLKIMVERSGRRTVPQIFFDEQHIGGFSDLLDYFKSHDEWGDAA